MKKIFYTNKSAFASSAEALSVIFTHYLQIDDVIIEKTSNGKPFCKQSPTPLFFSVTHTKQMLFIAFSDCEIGIDAELTTRKISPSVLKKLQTDNDTDGLRLWTIKESAVKWLGGTIARDFKKLRYENGNVFYNNAPLPVLVTHFEKEGHLLSVCCEHNFENAEWIPLST